MMAFLVAPHEDRKLSWGTQGNNQGLEIAEDPSSEKNRNLQKGQHRKCTGIV